jgi:hypothetical protein
MLGMRGVDLGLHGDDLGLNGDLLCSDGRRRERDLSRGGDCVLKRLPPSPVWPRTEGGGGSVSFPARTSWTSTGRLKKKEAEEESGCGTKGPSVVSVCHVLLRQRLHRPSCWCLIWTVPSQPAVLHQSCSCEPVSIM